MKRISLILLAATILIGGGCASKKYAKRGIKYEQAGLWEQASEAYMRSLTANRDNVDAIIGLKRSGQKVLDEQSMKTIKAYENDDLKQTVYEYIDAEQFQSKAAALGVELYISNMATEYFNDAKPKYVERIYAESQMLLNAEKFQQAEALLSEVKQLQPDYGNVQEMLKVSKCEPLYREAKGFMDAGLYRKAFTNLDKIIREFNTYKDVSELREEALSKAIITIKITDFKQGTGATADLVKSVQFSVVGKLNSLNNPFIKVIDVANTESIVEEQRRSLNTSSDLEVGKLMAAKAMLTGEVSALQLSTGKLNKQEKRGYLRQETKIKDPSTGEVKVKVDYKKVTYYVFNQRNDATISLKFQLTSTESGAVMVSDLVRSSQSDEVSYATFDGPSAQLVPGYWEKMGSSSPKDVISDTPYEVKALQGLLKARRDVIPVATLMANAIDDVAKRTAQKINQYNPEQ